MINRLLHDLTLIREQAPLVHNITNYVAMPAIANMLLALGASPLMAHAPNELSEIGKIAQSLVLNIGTLDEAWIQAMQQAQYATQPKNIPIILDPVGAGASQYRTQTALQLLKHGISILRGNASEIIALTDKNALTKGVDATVDSLTAETVAEYLVKKYNCVVVISGATDIVISATEKCHIHKPPFSLLTKVTAMGCSATAIIGAFAAVNHNYFAAAVHAMTLLGIAAEKAMQHTTGPGTFYAELLDVLYDLSARDLQQYLTTATINSTNTATKIILTSRTSAPKPITLHPSKTKTDYSLYLIADCAFCDVDLLPPIINTAVTNGVTCVQLRGKTLTHEQLLAAGRKLLNILNPLNIPLIVNDSIAAAKELDTAGVHLGQKDAPIEYARQELGPHKVIGLSLENFAQAQKASQFDVDYFGVGPIFATTTKPDAAPALGIEELQKIRAIVQNKPIIAIGGINSANATSVLQCGVDGIAVISAILGVKDYATATKSLRQIIDNARALCPLQYHPVLTIAGSDSSGGAGIQADIKAISATGGYAASVITALTAQNTVGVDGIFAVPAEFVSLQLDSVFSDINFLAIKIGMLYSPQIIFAVAERLKKWHAKNVVLDPVMVAKSGHKLITDEALTALKEKIFPLAYLITPNLKEAEVLLHSSITTHEQMEKAAQELAEIYHTNILVKGGHLTSAHADDVLFCYASKKIHWFSRSRIISKNTHGTGCTFSAAIASYLAQGNDLFNAITKAKDYLTTALTMGSRYTLGKGHGPIGHFL